MALPKRDDEERDANSNETPRRSGMRPRARATLTQPPLQELSADVHRAYERFARREDEWFSLGPVSEVESVRVETLRPSAPESHVWFNLTPIDRMGMQQAPSVRQKRRKTTLDFEAPDAVVIRLDARRQPKEG